MSFIKIYKEDWGKILDDRTYPTKGSLYVGYDLSGREWDSDILLQMDEFGNVSPIGSGSSGIVGPKGDPGPAGPAGSAGVSGSDGTSGTSGTSGIDGDFLGSSGTSGTSGSSGTSGTSGMDGDIYQDCHFNILDFSGITTGSTIDLNFSVGLSYTPNQPVIIAGSGIGNYLEGTVVSYNSNTGAMRVEITSINGSGYFEELCINLAGAAGGDGTSGTDGTSGSSGTSGTDGTSGSSGTSGTDGTSGSSGTSGIDGTSGTDGTSGSSGTSGTDGTSGSSGISGTDGTSGSSGSSGLDGYSGYSGYSGLGYSGYSGYSGISGYSGYSGYSGISGYSGYSGSGHSGYSGYSGSGYSGYSGISGYSGSGGGSSTVYCVRLNYNSSDSLVHTDVPPPYEIQTGFTFSTNFNVTINNTQNIEFDFPDELIAPNNIMGYWFDAANGDNGLYRLTPFGIGTHVIYGNRQDPVVNQTMYTDFMSNFNTNKIRIDGTTSLYNANKRTNPAPPGYVKVHAYIIFVF